MTEHPNKLIVIAGPTAIGKTSFAIEVAQHFNTEIISCDSRQLYKELEIGVARPSEQELNLVKHHFIASHSIHNDYNAGKYEIECNALLHELFKTKKVVVMTGGTGLYIKAATVGLDALPGKNDELRKELQFILDQKGIDALQEKAKEAGVKLDKTEHQNPQRLMRQIEIACGEVSQKPVIDRQYSTSYFYLDRDREELYNRINLRVDQMIDEGLIEEAKSLHQHTPLNALETVGYKELFGHFEGEISLETAIEKIKKNSRNYAKRQLTWFRNQGDYQRISPSLNEVLDRI